MLQVGRKEVKLFVEVNLIVGNSLYVGRLRHTFHEEQTGDNQSHFDSYGKVEDDGEEESN